MRTTLPVPSREETLRAIACCERVVSGLSSDTDRKIVIRLHADLHDELNREERKDG